MICYMEKIIKWIKENICYLIGAYILLGLSFNWFRRDFNFYEYIGILIGIVLILLPRFNKIRIGSILELEKKIEETKNEFERYQDITTNLLTQISTTNSFANQNIIYNIPYKTKMEQDEFEKDKKIIEKKFHNVDYAASEKQNSIGLKISNEEDINIKLMILRRSLEISLKRFLQKRFGNETKLKIDLIKMAKIYISETNNMDLYKPFLNVISICSAAVHGEDVEEKTANYVIDIGLSLIKQIERDV